MIELLPREHEALCLITRAGGEGLPITDVGISTACRLQLAGFASITKGPRQRVVATSQGAAHSRRDVFA